MEQELSIKINIADRFYPLVLQPQQEETVRKAARLINDKLKELQQTFAVKDKQDMLAMTLLEISTDWLALKDGRLAQDEKLQSSLLATEQLLTDIKL